MPRPPGYTRERMMDVAERLFHRHGFGGVSVEDVTSAVGVKKPDLYNHFRDKNELYTAVRLRRLHRLESDLVRVLGADAPIADAPSADAPSADAAFTDRLTGVVLVLLRHPFFLSALAQREAETFLPPDVRDMLFARAYAAVYLPLLRFLRGGGEETGLPESRVSFACEALIGLCAHFADAVTLGDPAHLLRTASAIAAFWRHGAAGLKG